VPDFRRSLGSLTKGFGPAVTSAVHDRMPVILDPDAFELWLDPGMKDVAAVSELLT
jgi:putative SOS response-associated peptidase YedK